MTPKWELLAESKFLGIYPFTEVMKSLEKHMILSLMMPNHLFEYQKDFQFPKL